ncbi:gaba permease-like protein [Kockovaella imperatae]|uniref:Gaba permease-like protein n=1 Tax=Kockovaella imperatae TaxID=4999 RepID=A0A1Y1UKY7_9TREE|nr:gaba permease-like protein [Kockovaella imperatae]ORX38207.1 gaba permease-like protein [Kockovaella imperatae]
MSNEIKEVTRPNDSDELVGFREDHRTLEELGYAQELPRTKSFLTLWAMTIVLSSVPYGLSTTFFYTLGDGGAMVAIWDWIIMSSIYVCVAVSLGEIASQYPVSGGVYYWSYMLSPRKLKPLVSWIVGWLSVVGNITVTLAVNFATAQLILSSVILFNPTYEPQPFHTVLTSMAIIILLGVIALVGQQWMHHVDTFTIIIIVSAVLATVITLPVKAHMGHRSAEYVFTKFVDMGAGWPRGMQWVLGLIQGAYCFSATGMLPAMAEEAILPELSIPRAMVWGVVVNGTLGLMFLLPIMFTLGDLSRILASPTGQPLPEIFLEATGSTKAAFGLFFLILVIGLSCGLACSQAASRCVWAFARDGGLPGRSILGKTSARFEMPLNGFLLHSIIQCALACIYFGSTEAFNAFLGVSVICLGSACFVPILVSFLEGRKKIQGAKFYKGKFGYFANVVSIAWFTLAIPILSFPPYLPVTEVNMNYASVVFVAAAALCCVWYLAFGRKHYQGPPDSHTGL